MKRSFLAVAVLLALAPVARAQSLEKTTIAIPAEAGFIKPSDGLKTYTDLFTNEYVK